MKIGIFGSSHKNNPEIIKQTKEIGRLLALKNHEVVTGGSPGYPHIVASSALAAGGKATVYAVGLNLKDHKKYHATDISKYTNIIYQKKYFKKELSMIDNYARSLDMVMDIDTAVIIGGRVGTMYEISILCGMAKDFFVLEDSGGITKETIRSFVKEGHKENSSVTFLKNSNDLTSLV